MHREQVAHVPRPVEEPTEKLFHDVEASGVLPDGIAASEATTVVLCNLLMRVSGGEADEFVVAAPRTLRALLGRCMSHRGEQQETFNRDVFLQRVANQLGIQTHVADRLARAVFAATRARLPSHEVIELETQLPRDLLAMFRR